MNKSINTLIIIALCILWTGCKEGAKEIETNTTTAAQTDVPTNNSFPDDFLGTYTGTLNITSPNGQQEVPMQFKMLATDSTGFYTYTIIYGDQEPRQYNLVRTSNPNTFLVDENNGIVLESSYANRTLYSTYEVDGNLLNSTEVFYDDRMEFMIGLSKLRDTTLTGNEESALVKNYPVAFMQRATLLKQKDTVITP